MARNRREEKGAKTIQHPHGGREASVYIPVFLSLISKFADTPERLMRPRAEVLSVFCFVDKKRAVSEQFLLVPFPGRRCLFYDRMGNIGWTNGVLRELASSLTLITLVHLFLV